MLAMIFALLTAAPSPTPVGSPEPLRTIVTVHSTTFCEQYAKHVNSAIDSAVRNDGVLGTTIMTLRSGELADNDLSRLHEIHRLEDLGDKIYRDYRAGLLEVGHLRDLAKSAPDPQEQKDMKDAADALGGVLYRQHLIQRDLDGFVAYLGAMDMQQDTNRDELNAEFSGSSVAGFPYNNGQYGMSNSQYLSVGMNMGHEATHPYAYHTWNDDVHMAGNASSDFQGRMPDIFRDEVTAAQRVDQASQHC